MAAAAVQGSSVTTLNHVAKFNEVYEHMSWHMWLESVYRAADTSKDRDYTDKGLCLPFLLTLFFDTQFCK